MIRFVFAVFVCVFICLSALFTSGQAENRNYVVLLSGDTLKGKVRLPARFSKKVVFKRDGVSKRYKPNELRGFRKDDLVFESIISNLYASHFSMQSIPVDRSETFSADTSFGIRMVKGPLNMFWIVDKTHGNHYVVQKGDGVYADLYNHKYVDVFPDSLATKERLRGFYIFQRYNYIRLLSRLMSDCPAINGEIDEDILKADRLTALASRYNECVSPSSNQYVWKPIAPRMRLGISAGISFTRWKTDYPVYQLSQATLIAPPAPFVAFAGDLVPGTVKQRLVWQTRVGLFHYRLGSAADDSNYKLGLMLNYAYLYNFDLYYAMATTGLVYRFRQGKIRPYCGLGISYNFPLSRDLKVTRTSSIGPSTQVEQETIEFFPDDNPAEPGTYSTVGVCRYPFDFQLTYSDSLGNTFIPMLAFYGSKRQTVFATLTYTWSL